MLARLGFSLRTDKQFCTNRSLLKSFGSADSTLMSLSVNCSENLTATSFAILLPHCLLENLVFAVSFSLTFELLVCHVPCPAFVELILVFQDRQHFTLMDLPIFGIISTGRMTSCLPFFTLLTGTVCPTISIHTRYSIGSVINPTTFPPSIIRPHCHLSQKFCHSVSVH